MGGLRHIRPALYLVMACASLCTLTRFIDPLLEFKEKGLSSNSAAAMIQSALGRGGGATDAAPALADIHSLLSGGSSGASPAAPAESAAPREIVVRDVRYVDDLPRTGRDHFTQAMQLHSQGRLAEAEALYRRILEADPRDTGVHRNLASSAASKSATRRVGDTFTRCGTSAATCRRGSWRCCRARCRTRRAGAIRDSKRCPGITAPPRALSARPCAEPPGRHSTPRLMTEGQLDRRGGRG